MVNKKKLLSLLGLARKARKVVSGEFSTEKSVKSGRSHLVIVSEEASENTKKMFTNMCTHYKVPIYLFGSKDELGHAIGQEFRASLSVEDAGFAKSMVELMNINGGSMNESK
ncbi:MAG: ribosomal L7Ae/L30e/S12e/Gadd45 family protein [Clostridium sp.]|nr:ribosomal L7Ae/L30e/S12e/Gadd45 family protein [Clostridium sp.]